ncbi:MAG: hypothetical protein IT350_16635 [Deltaproteobacteria bacterium]|nr:hypothetical protein [Deltaproteobacteria bacterium]
MTATAQRDAKSYVDARSIIVERLRHERRGRRVGAIATAAFALVAAHAPLWSGLARRGWPDSWSAAFLVALGVVLALALAATTALVFGAPLVRRGTLAVMAAVDLAAIVAFLVATSSPQPLAEMPRGGWACFEGGFVHAVAMTGFLWIVRDYLRQSPAALWLTSALVAGTAVIALHYHCADQGFWHLTIQHGAVLVPSAVLVWLVISRKTTAASEFGRN